jgi:hypothetical protein
MLCWFSVKWRTFLVSEYNAISASQFGTTSPQRTGGRWNGRRQKLQLVSKRKTRWVVRAHTAGRGWKNKTGYGRNRDGPNAHTPRQATSVWATFRNASFMPTSAIGKKGLARVREMRFMARNRVGLAKPKASFGRTTCFRFETDFCDGIRQRVPARQQQTSPSFRERLLIRWRARFCGLRRPSQNLPFLKHEGAVPIIVV